MRCDLARNAQTWLNIRPGILEFKANIDLLILINYRSIEIKNETMQDPTEKNIRKGIKFWSYAYATFLENDTKNHFIGEAICRNGFRKFYFTS
jgi:hypothetical protein